MSDDEKRRKAKEIAETRYWFRIHLILFVIINIGLFGVWYLTGDAAFVWPLIPLVFWAIGLIAH